MSKEIIFFMRFYGVSKTRVQECVNKVLELHPKGKLKEIIPTTKTSTLGGMFFLQAHNSLEARIKFNSTKDYDACFADTKCREIYMQYSADPSLHPTFMPRNPGDKCLGASR